MSPKQLHVYTEEVLIHTEVALREYDQFVTLALNSETRQMREVWVRLQSHLTHLGMVSKLLFAPNPRKPISKTRAEELRKYLNVAEDSVLDNRDARNAIEHLDEHIDNWLENNSGNILECVFEDRPSYDYIDKDQWKVRRAFIIEESVFIIQDENGPKEMSLNPMVDELKRIKRVCEEKLANNDLYHVINPNSG